MKGRISIALFLALVVVSIAVTLAVAEPITAPSGAASAKGHAFDVTFTKWITTPPQMIGVVGGAVGSGTFEGQIVGLRVEGNMEYVDAIYHINGGRHSFTAQIHATQDDSVSAGVITGTVTEGWLKGASLTGEYKVLAQCPIETPNNGNETLCFQGVLHLRPGSQSAK